MLWSKLFIPTLRESPGDTDPAGRRFLRRAGYLRGENDWLFLGQRSLNKIAAIVGEEMARVGGQQMQPAGDDGLLTLARELRSYKQLPQVWYRFGAMVEAIAVSLETVDLEADCARILDRCGVAFERAGGSLVVFSEAGETSVAVCKSCGYQAPLELAQAKPAKPTFEDPAGDREPEEFHTPGLKTIADIAGFTGLPEAAQMKSLVHVARGKTVLVMVRGDHQMSGAKFAALLGDRRYRPAKMEEIRELFGAAGGSLGPVGVRNVPVYADLALQGRRNMIAGANRDDYHLRDVTPGEDFEPQWVDLRRVAAGEACASCGHPLEIKQAFELARVTPVQAHDIRVTEPGGREAPPLVNSCWIAFDRILLAAAEVSHDQDGLIPPQAMAPFDVIVTPANMADAAQLEAARSIYAECLALGLDAVLDDRDERAGSKFKDADLMGAPFRITVGKKLATGLVELVHRKTRVVTEVSVAEVTKKLGDSE